MKIYTLVEFDIATWELLREICYEYSGDVALCDRSLTQRSNNAILDAERVGAGFGANASGIQGNLVPRLESEAVNPPGYGPLGLSQMETQAQEAAAGSTGAAQERSKLQAVRTGNIAGLPSTQVAEAEAGARGGGATLQNILAKNAELKARQQQEANQGLAGILGEDIGGQTRMAGIVPEDINAATGAEKVGWVQNVAQILTALGELGKGAGAARGGGGG